MSDLWPKPGKIERYTHPSHTWEIVSAIARCAGCHETAIFDCHEANLSHEAKLCEWTRLLVVPGLVWMHLEGYGHCCPACRKFLEAVP